MCTYVHACVPCIHLHVRGPEDNWWEGVFSFHHAGPRVKTAVIGLGSRYLYPELLSHWLACVPLSSGLKLVFSTTVANMPFSKEPGLYFFHLIRIYSVLYNSNVIFWRVLETFLQLRPGSPFIFAIVLPCWGTDAGHRLC